MNIGESIRKYRKERGWSQRKLGQLSGVSHTQIANYETNTTTPTLETIVKIANALEISYLLLIDAQLEWEALEKGYDFFDEQKKLENSVLKKRNIFNIVNLLKSQGIMYSTDIYLEKNQNGWLIFDYYDDPIGESNKCIKVVDDELLELEKDINKYFNFKIQELIDKKNGKFSFYFDSQKVENKD